MTMNVSPNRQTGATMVEIMIAILVFSVGLLGIASTQTLGLTNTQSALSRSYATQLAYEMADIMRINRAVTNLGTLAAGNLFYDFNTTQNLGYTADAGCQDAATQCSPNDMVEDALVAWQDRVETLLPGGAAKVVFDDGANGSYPNGSNSGNYKIVITWVDLKTAAEQNVASQETNDLGVVTGRLDVNELVDNSLFRYELEIRL